MAQDAELTRCNGDSRGTFISGDAELARRFIASAWPRLCGAENLIHRFRTECFQLDEPEWDYWHWTPYWPAYRCDPPQCRYPREYLAIPGGIWPHLCHCRTADPGCIYAVCNQTGVCIYPDADGSRCSLIRRGKPCS